MVNKKAIKTINEVVFEDNGESAAIVITGRAYANLKKIESALASLSWCGDDALDVLYYCGGERLVELGALEGKGALKDGAGHSLISNDIYACVDCGCDLRSLGESSRFSELVKAIESIEF